VQSILKSIVKNKLILASTSPYRKILLSRLGIPFVTAKPQCDEELLKSQFQGTPQELSEFLSLEKAKSISSEPGACVIGGDQILLFKGEILGKPQNHEKAFEMLSQLQGHQHTLLTSMAILPFDKPPVLVSHKTQLSMKKLTQEQIENYLKLDLPYDCAGSYKIEKHGIGLFNQIITDDFTGIEGLPLLQLSQILSNLGIEGFHS